MTKLWEHFGFFNETSRLTPTVAISACLTGEKVRYDGQHKRLNTVEGYLAAHVKLKPICPEVGAGLAVPRPPVNLVKENGETKALGRDDPTMDLTALLSDYSHKSVNHLQTEISGYIFKSRSPSCGLNSTPIYNNDVQIETGSGIQASYFSQQLPWLPMIEETELQTPAQCDQFILNAMIMLDLRLATLESGLEKVHVHFQPALLTADEDQYKKMCAYVKAEDSKKYWTAAMKLLGNGGRGD